MDRTRLIRVMPGNGWMILMAMKGEGRRLGRGIMLVVEAMKRVISHKFKRSVNILFKDET